MKLIFIVFLTMPLFLFSQTFKVEKKDSVNHDSMYRIDRKDLDSLNRIYQEYPYYEITPQGLRHSYDNSPCCPPNDFAIYFDSKVVIDTSLPKVYISKGLCVFYGNDSMNIINQLIEKISQLQSELYIQKSKYNELKEAIYEHLDYDDKSFKQLQKDILNCLPKYKKH